LEPLLELVLRAKKSFRKPSFKAIYKRNSESLSNIVNLANLALEEGDEEMAVEILGFVLVNKISIACPGTYLSNQNK
jgi:hypothetical protein